MMFGSFGGLLEFLFEKEAWEDEGPFEAGCKSGRYRTRRLEQDKEIYMHWGVLSLAVG